MKYVWFRKAAAVFVVALLILPSATPAAAAASDFPVDTGAITIPDTELTETGKILHVLNRLGYGPRPGDIGRVRRMGVEKWIERQLMPDTIPDPDAEELLRQLPTLAMSSSEIMITFTPPRLLRQLMLQLTSRLAMDSDAAGGMFPEVDRREGRPTRGQNRDAPKPDNASMDETSRPGDRNRWTPPPLTGARLLNAELTQARLLRALHSERQLQEIMTDFWFNHFNVYARKSTTGWLVSGYERDAIRPHVLGRFRDLLGATARHPAMLVYLDNWRSADPQASQNARRLRAAYEDAAQAAGLSAGGVAAEILRGRGMDQAEIDRMTQVDRRPAVRRNNQMMVAERQRGAQRAPGGTRRTPPANRRTTNPRRPKLGLNENYARELLELHTLGVDGGYTQQDVIEVARCFAGWSITPLLFGQQFVYLEEYHDAGEKVVLGQRVESGGQKDGDRVLDLLARHPSTARFISLKLARRFVSDNPPASLVDAMAKTFLETDGDIGQVLRTLFGSPEFWSADTVNAKFKTPLTFLMSAVRATGMRFDKVNAAVRGSLLSLSLKLRGLGQPLYAAPPPTGYSEAEEAWVSAGGMLDRFKVAASLAAGRLRMGQPTEKAAWIEARTPDELLSKAEEFILGRSLSPDARRALLRELKELDGELRRTPAFEGADTVPAPLGPLVVGWILASPDFQRH